MSLIGSSIPNFVQGVSQQAAALRLPSQVAAQENAVPSLVEGLLKRPPLDYSSTVLAASYTGAKIHFSTRSLTERYIMVVTDGDLKVYDKATGAAKTVTYPDGKTYLDVVGAASEQFRLLTVADTTFVVNRETIVAMSTATSAAQDFQALVAVKQGDYSTRYVIYVDGTEVANVVTSDTVVSETRTDWIAGELVTDLNTGGTGLPGLTATYDTAVQYGSSILIKRTDGSAFEVSTWDSRSDDALKVATDRVQRFTDLPAVAPDGYIVEVIGDQTNNFDNYFVQFSADDDNSTVGSKGIWNETLQPGLTYTFDAATMPHTLVRQADGTFIFAKATWNDRLVGDAVSAPEPSFVGETINGVVFFKNRVGLLADDNVVLSRTSGFFNFWRATAKAILDTDPIDVAASYEKVAILNSAIAYDKKLLCFSDQSRWALSGGQVLSPTNVSMDLIGEDAADPEVLPTASGNTVFFMTPRGDYSTVLEMQVKDDEGRTEAFDAAEHVPTYIPSGVTKITASNAEKTLAVLASTETASLYVYNWHWSGRSKDQAAWHKFTFTGAEVLDIEFFESELWIVLVKEGKTLLTRIKLSPGQLDAGQTFQTLLDYKMDETVATPSYNAGTDQTTITLPVGLNNPLVVLNGASQGVLKHTGSAGVVTSIVITGDLSSTGYYVGEAYDFKATLSEVVYRPRTKDGGLGPAIVSGRLQLRTLSFLYASTGYFKVRVTALYRTAYEYIFTGRIMGQGGNVIGDVPIVSGSFRVPVKSKSDRVTVELESDSFLPCKFLSADWEGLISIRAPRV